MRAGIVNSSWVLRHPTKRMDASFWLDVLDWMQERGLETNDENIDKAIAALEDNRRGNEERT